MPQDQTQNNNPQPEANPQTNAPSGYVARVNDKILGFFGNSNDADDAIKAYQMENVTNIDDEFEIANYSPI